MWMMPVRSCKRLAIKYDLVVFATLDSHTVFSSLSSIRLDNFVFTKDSIENARTHLTADGGIAINFFASKPWLSQRHLNTLRDVMGEKLLAYSSSELQEAILLAALIFAKAFEEAKIPILALGSNLVGTLVGGILEYLDMWIGLRWLNIIALLLYGLSYLFLSNRLKTRNSSRMSHFSVEVSKSKNIGLI